jgi:hypothetical protein
VKKPESGTSSKNLMRWWRRAVLAVWGDRCAWCGRQPVECHHIVRRAKAILRYDWRNGIPLCATCHAEADTASGRRRVYSMMDMEYLESMEMWLIKDYLKSRGISREQWLSEELEELKAVVASPHEYKQWGES